MKQHTLIIIGLIVAIGLTPIATMAQSVPLQKINTGDKSLDTQVHDLIKCLTKVKHGADPTKAEADSCYDEIFGTSGGTSFAHDGSSGGN